MKNKILVAAIVFASVGANAEEDADKFLTQGGLLVSCEALAEGRNASYEPMACYAFINGAIQGSSWAYFSSKKKLPYCPPEHGSQSQAARVVVKYFREHPELDHQPAGMSIMQAFISAFPCK